MNQRVNLVSRADEDSIASRHIPHCLTLAIRTFPDNARVCDWGTGGGLPLIPLAILFPRVHFIGVDAVQKKDDGRADHGPAHRSGECHCDSHSRRGRCDSSSPVRLACDGPTENTVAMAWAECGAKQGSDGGRERVVRARMSQGWRSRRGDRIAAGSISKCFHSATVYSRSDGRSIFQYEGNHTSDGSIDIR